MTNKGYILFFTLISLFTLTFSSCVGTGGILVKQVAPEDMVHYSQIHSFADLPLTDNTYILYFSQGDKIPLQIVLNNDFVEVDDKKISLVAKRNIYFMIKDPERDEETNGYKITSDSKIFISFDAVRWAPIHNSDGFKKIAGFTEENVIFGFEVDNQHGVQSNLTIENR